MDVVLAVVLVVICQTLLGTVLYLWREREYWRNEAEHLEGLLKILQKRCGDKGDF